MNEAINLSKDLTTLKKLMVKPSSAQPFDPLDYLAELATSLEVEHDFSKENPTSYSKGRAFQFLDVLNSKVVVLTLEEELKVLENFILEVPTFLSKCFSSLTKKLVLCSDCGAQISTMWKTTFGFTIDLTKAGNSSRCIKHCLDRKFNSREIKNTSNLKCPKCKKRSPVLRSESKLAVPPLYLMIRFKCFNAIGSLLPMAKEAEIDDIYLDFDRTIVDPAWDAFKKNPKELKHQDEYPEVMNTVR